MKKHIKVKMIDYGWPGFRPEGEYIYRLLSDMYDVELCDDPDYLIDGCFGFEDLDYPHRCVRILTNGENFVADFNRFDYMVGHDHITFGDRYLRMPHFTNYGEFDSVRQRSAGKASSLSDEELLNRKFCSFVISNFNGDPFRMAFFERLCKYKKVDSGGRHLNNIGGPVADKLDFCRQYKFNIAFENSASPGYVTEKVMQPLAVNSVPIYWGDPLVGSDFNAEALVVVRNKDDVDRAIEEIVRLDTHDDEYLAKCRANPLAVDSDHYERAYRDFLRNIFEQPLEGAKRLNEFGYQARWRERMRRYCLEDKILYKPLRAYQKISKKFKFG